ncbi:MAG: outer membrane beta-barrel protein [Bacteroidia bacterium]
MKKIILILILFCNLLAFAQTFSISGELVDKDNQPVMFANVMVLKSTDSSLVKGAISNENGFFSLENISSAHYLVKVSYVGFNDLYVPVFIQNESKVLGKLKLNSKATKLDEVNVVTTVTPVIQKGDTTQINAGAYKVNKDASSEDLVTKMPGITIQDGQVQAQGEAVKKVLVDGKEFFGDDANAVLKNLPAEVVDKIQVFDKKSDQSQFSGFDDGNSAKTINIITKPQFRNGTFGKASAAYGYDEKWRGAFNVNFFKDKRRITILGNTNNINEQNFSTEDLLGVVSSASSGGNNRGGGGRPQGMGAGGGRYGQQNEAGNFLVDQKNGVSTTHAFGINYADQWKNVTFNGSYFMNYAENTSLTNTFRQYVTSAFEGLAYQEANTSTSNNINHRANFKIEWKIDSLNAVTVQPKLSIQQNSGKVSLLGENQQPGILISNTISSSNSQLIGSTVSIPVLYRHSFNKSGRTLSLNVTPGYNSNKGENNWLNYTNNFIDTTFADTIHQLSELNTFAYTMSTSAVYTEPLNQYNQLMLSYGNSFNSSDSDRETFNVNGAENAFDTTLSNVFNSLYQAHSVGTAMQYNKDKLMLSYGVTYQYAELTAQQFFPDNFSLRHTFNSLLPNLRLHYKFSSKQVFRMFYRTSNNPPTVSQLQRVINNTNPLQLITGNPNLKQNWQNMLHMHYSSSNTEKSTALFVLLGGTYTQNYIVSNTFIAQADTLIAPGILLTSGGQLYTPVNQNGYYSLRSFNNYSFPFKAIKCNMSANIGGTHSRTPGIVNNKLMYTYNSNVGLGITLSSNISERVDFTVSSNTTYNNTFNTLQTNLNTTYYNQNSKFKIQVMPWKGIVLQTELNHQYNTGLSADFNQNFMLWNAAIGYKFLKNNQAELRLSVFDILNQNNNIKRNVMETYYEDVRTNILQQYFLLTFTYTMKQFNESKTK